MNNLDRMKLALAEPDWAPAMANEALRLVEEDRRLCDRIADHVLRRDFAQASASRFGDSKQFRSLLGAVAKAVNRVELDGRTLKIYEADDKGVLGSQTVAVNNDPPAITELDTD